LSYGKKVVSNVFYYSLDFITITLAGYLFWVIMGKMLVPEQYGILTTVIALFYVLANVCSLGLFESISKLVPELIDKKKIKQAHGIISHSLKLALLLSLVFAGLIYFFAPQLSQIIYSSAEMVAPLQLLSFIVLTGVAWTIVRGIFISLQKFKKLFVSELIGNVLRVLLAILLVSIGLQALGGAASWSISFFIIIIVLVLLLPKLKPGKFDKKRFYRYSISSLIYLLSFFLLLQGGLIVLGILGSMTSVAMLGATVVISQILLFIPFIFAHSILPTLSELWRRSKKSAIKILSISTKINILTVLPLFILFAMFSETAIRLMYTDQYLPATILFPGFFLGTLLFGISNLLLIFIYSIGKPVKRMFLIVAAMILNIILSVYLVPFYGAQGAVIAFLTSQILLLTLSLYYTTRMVELKIRRKSFLIIPVTLLFSIVLYSTSYLGSFIAKGLVVIFDLVLYVLLLFVLRIVSSDDIDILDHFPDKYGGNFIKQVIRECYKLSERKV